MTDRDAKRAIIYCRVSTRAQVENGNGLASQAEKCEAYASLHDLDVVEIIRDAGISGATAPEDRPGLAKALSLLDSGEADCIIATELSRLSRVAFHNAEIFKRAKESGWHVCAIFQGVDTRTPAGKLMAGILAEIAEYERELIRERIRAGLDKAKREGKRLGHKTSRETREAGARALDLRPGETWQKIADRLNAEGYRRHNGATWNRSAIYKAAKAVERDREAESIRQGA